MAATPRKSTGKLFPSSPFPITPQPLTPRRSPRLISPDLPSRKRESERDEPIFQETPRSVKKSRKSTAGVHNSPKVICKLSPVSPDRIETRKRRRKIFYKRVEYDGGDFEIGDDVYVRRREDAESDEEDPEIEDCRICFKARKIVMIECDECLGGFHLKCLRPPVKDIPEGKWLCPFCEGRKSGESVQLPKPPEGKRIRRTFKEKLLAGDLWAARIES